MSEQTRIESDPPRIPLIGEEAPAFSIETTQGVINFPADYRGKWVILFSHPADFTPVCTTEFMTLAAMTKELRSLDAELIGLSPDSVYSHIAWLNAMRDKLRFRDIQGIEVDFPVIADMQHEVARRYGMIHPQVSAAYPVRSLFIIDPQGRIKAFFFYPQPVGRNFAELKRVLLAVQAAAEHNVATPADWQPGEEVVVPPPGQYGLARIRAESAQPGLRCQDWFLCFKYLEPSEQRSEQ